MVDNFYFEIFFVKNRMQLEIPITVNDLQPVDFLRSITLILEEIISETDKLQVNPKSIFHSPKKPSISLYSYLQRISKYTSCSESCYILSLIYLDRIQELNPDVLLNSFCIHRFLITAIMIAIKYHDDDYYKNEFYAKVGGIPIKELNEFENKFLSLIGFNLFVHSDLYSLYKRKIQQYTSI